MLTMLAGLTWLAQLTWRLCPLAGSGDGLFQSTILTLSYKDRKKKKKTKKYLGYQEPWPRSELGTSEIQVTVIASELTFLILKRIQVFNPLKPKLIWIIFKNPICTAKKTQHFTISKINLLMLFKEIIAIYTENNTKHINTKCWAIYWLLKQLVRIGTARL
jgi:hypothetical protein